MKDKLKTECRFARERIEAYLSKEIDGDEALDIRNHLRTCKACREVLNAETRLNRMMQSALKPRVESGYWERTWPRIQVAMVARKQRSTRRILRWIVSSVGVAVSTAALFLGLFLPSISTSPIATHDATYFADLSPEPPTFAEVTKTETDDADKAVDLAVLSLGNTPPSQRITHFKNLEGL
ncbi:hypothetical protein GF359_08820 [candidate division WOR-3 bacterium]|uniref:Putative zinc-finger domain-containing protein n=1 Tax=candidate division WOR-3 bacterium TaxID=2052148 RepID=A0A9D5KA68_UNCW3|nr:hypothetical protein [candidate division WOR-3 bacterium]MBD3365302.1 hypothetical protein [candidate division WOR-3 bacterium]